MFIWLYDSPVDIVSFTVEANRGERELTVQRNPSKARASPQSTCDLVDPRIVKLHPLWLVAAEMAGLDIFPEVVRLEVLARGNGVGRPLALCGETHEFEGANENGARGRGVVVLFAAHPKHNGTETEHDCREQPRAPESNVLFHVDHGDLAGESTHVDKLRSVRD